MHFVVNLNKTYREWDERIFHRGDDPLLKDRHDNLAANNYLKYPLSQEPIIIHYFKWYFILYTYISIFTTQKR
jgi:hypothetical protein